MGVGHAKDERFGEPEVLVPFGSRTLRKCTDGTMVPVMRDPLRLELRRGRRSGAVAAAQRSE